MKQGAGQGLHSVLTLPPEIRSCQEFGLTCQNMAILVDFILVIIL